MTTTQAEGVRLARPALRAWWTRLRASRLLPALALSQALAVAWWLVALWVRPLDIIPVWFDQGRTFTQTWGHLADPYAIPGYVNLPWGAVLLVPFSFLPLPVAVLAQLCIYFAALAALVCRHGGGLRRVALALTSFMALDNALQLNIDWLAALGLLAPPALSGLLVLVKPQVALGGWLGWPRPAQVRAVLGALVVVLLSFAVWGAWPLDWLAATQREGLVGLGHNIAPMALLHPLLSLAAGAALGVLAVRRQEVALGVLAWLFAVPYVAFYSLLLHFTLAAARWPRVAFIISAAMWLVYGGAIVVGLLS